MPVFEREGLDFHYLDEGDHSGLPFVFQHGLGGDVSQPADDVAALMYHLGLQRAVVGGISMGAGVALNLASRHPKRVAGLALSRPARLAELTPKTESEESHAAGTQAAIAGFLDRVFWPAAPKEATRR